MDPPACSSAGAISISLGKVSSDGAAASSPGRNSDTQQSEISVKQFLDLLKTAYQVHDDLEGLLLSKGMVDVVNWIKMKGLCGTSLSSKKGESKTAPPVGDGGDGGEAAKMNEKTIDELESQMQERLSSVLNEGIMDSVLPLIVPSGSLSNQGQVELKTLQRRVNMQKSISADKLTTMMNVRKKSGTYVTKSESDVEIHVCDEIRAMRKDFICNQKLLVEQMGYFADVTKEQKLEDMDISVHCDINIFEWLMRWVKRDQCLAGDVPTLEVPNAVPVLVSASFLQMEPLVNECLHFCHKNMNDILKTSSSLSCLNDTILSRLAAMYTNMEVEAIKDRKDKIQSKLYCKLIQSLCEIETETLRGHYCTLARCYRCKHCQQLINPKFGMQIPCVAQCMRLQFDGSIRNHHQRDPNWNLNEYILSLYKLMKNWRKVYWRLWGTCHYLYCNVCKRFFPTKQEGWCRYHPDLPQYFTLDTQKPPLPVGRYPCCGERAYRFQILDERSGCLFRDHTIGATDIKDAAIACLLDTMRGLITEEAPKLVFPDRLTRLIAREPTDPDDSKLDTKEMFWWDGLEIVPPRPKLGLFSELDPKPGGGDFQDDDYSDSAGSDESETGGTGRSSSSSDDCSSDDSEESTVTLPSPRRRIVKGRNCKKKVRHVRGNTGPKQWQLNLSSRSNQDMQRLNEEAAFKKMASILNAKTKLTAEIEVSKTTSKNAYKSGGIWVRLESEWKDKNMPAVNKAKTMCNGKVRMKTNRLM